MKSASAFAVVLVVLAGGAQAQRLAEYLDYSIFQAVPAPTLAPPKAPLAPEGAPSIAPEAASAPSPITAPSVAPAPVTVPAPAPALPPVAVLSPPPATPTSPLPVVVSSPPPVVVASPPPPAVTGTTTNYPFTFIQGNNPGLPGRKLLAGVTVTTSNTVTFTTYILPGTSSPPLTDPTSAPTYTGPAPTGEVSITDEDGTVVATTAVTSGQAISFATLSNGLHKLTTQYSGDATYAGSKTSVPYTVLVQGKSGGGGVTIG